MRASSWSTGSNSNSSNSSNSKRYSSRIPVDFVHVVLLLLLVESPILKVEAAVNFTAGNDLCPCLQPDQLSNINDYDLSQPSTITYLDGMDSTTYGVYCGNHDVNSFNCSNPACQAEANVIPKSLGCDNSYCQLNFCYVDPNNCNLMFRRSEIFPTSYRFFSYATCWDVDSFTASKRISSLENKVFKVGFNSNSGGWQGSYSSAREQFSGPVELWSGPTVQFAIEGALNGNYQMNLTEPPDFLRARAEHYFQSTSNFDFCVYATSLGYLDFCLAQYTISDKRAATTDWLVLGSQDLHLIVQYETETDGWERFVESFLILFSPFTPGVWVFLIFVVIPVLGSLMIIHEYDHPGSSYAKQEEVIVSDNKRRGCESVETRPVPIYRHIIRAIYINLLSVLQQSYVHSVVTYGAMLNLLGISFFVLTIIAVYTANLAAILTSAAQRTSIDSLADALKANYRICSERKNLETVQALYPEIQDIHLVVDPVEIGGDGLPGFNCPDCAARVRVFDFLDVKKAAMDENYCHAAFAPLEDLEVEQRGGRHCEKTAVGSRVGSTQTGIPVNERRSPELVSYFLKLKNDGVFDRELKTGQPQPNCPEFDAGGEEGVALNISQLTGIWIVSFGFATAGLLVTYLQPKYQKRQATTVKSVHQYDQTGHKINVLEKDDAWMDEKSVMKGSKRIYVGESRWGKAAAKHGGTSTLSSTAFQGMSMRATSGRRGLDINLSSDDEDDDDAEFPKAPPRRIASLGARPSDQNQTQGSRYTVGVTEGSSLESLQESSLEFDQGEDSGGKGSEQSPRNQLKMLGDSDSSDKDSDDSSISLTLRRKAPVPC